MLTIWNIYLKYYNRLKNNSGLYIIDIQLINIKSLMDSWFLTQKSTQNPKSQKKYARRRTDKLGSFWEVGRIWKKIFREQTFIENSKKIGFYMFFMHFCPVFEVRLFWIFCPCWTDYRTVNPCVVSSSLTGAAKYAGFCV